jgi:oligoribonuclease NrnB/cAMP/cGMP phosphodiesterase (DHH superfamily)
MNTTVIYHRADYDGIFSREVAKRFLPATTNYIGWDYGDPVPEIPLDTKLYMIDLSIDALMTFPGLIWIDHHKSAIEKFPAALKGYRIDGVAACRLAYQWFLKEQRDLAGMVWMLPDKLEFDERRVEEPLALTLAGEYDVWVHKGDGAVEFQFGLDAQPELDWDELFDSADYVNKLVGEGAIAMRCYTKRDAVNVTERGFIHQWEGLNFLTLNTVRSNSNSFAARDVPETGHDALMTYFWNGKVWTFSLYHAKHNKEIDLSAIASKYKGGGHKGACGFQLAQLPF